MTTRQLVDEITNVRSKLASWQFAQLRVLLSAAVHIAAAAPRRLVKSVTTLFV